MNYKELEMLINAAIDGGLDELGLQHLAEALLQDHAALDIYRKYITTHLLLIDFFHKE